MQSECFGIGCSGGQSDGLLDHTVNMLMGWLHGVNVRLSRWGRRMRRGGQAERVCWGKEEAGVKADSSGSGVGAAACRVNREVMRAAGRIKLGGRCGPAKAGV